MRRCAMVGLSVMRAPYRNKDRLRSPFLDVARTLLQTRSITSRLAPLILMSEPERTPDIEHLAKVMPRGSALIYRHFGADNRHAVAKRLRAITAECGVQFLIGADPELALAVQADGVHFRRDPALSRARDWREKQPGWIITQAGIKSGDYDHDVSALDALFMSSVFSSKSPSSGTPIGLEGLSRACRTLPVPIIALGGITRETAPQLVGSGATGLAAIGGLAEELRGFIMSDPIKANPDTIVTITRVDTIRGFTFLADIEGETAQGELTLRKVRDRVYNANHTGVPSEIGGRGIGKRLVKAMVEDAREKGYKIIPGCPFVAKLFERKPDLAEDVAVEA